jgi:hypothetical protein
MKICFSILLALGLFEMGLGQLQRAGEVSRWSSIYANIAEAYGGDLPQKLREELLVKYSSDTSLYNGTSVLGLAVTIASGIGLVLAVRRRK